MFSGAASRGSQPDQKGARIERSKYLSRAPRRRRSRARGRWRLTFETTGPSEGMWPRKPYGDDAVRIDSRRVRYSFDYRKLGRVASQKASDPNKWAKAPPHASALPLLPSGPGGVHASTSAGPLESLRLSSQA